MEYLIKYKAWTDHNNGYDLFTHTQIEENFENLCKEVALLESIHKEDKDFSYEIFALREINNTVITENDSYLVEKRKIVYEQNIKKIKDAIYSKKREISNHRETMMKYGKWKQFDEQIAVMTSDLENLEKALI